MPVKVRCKHCSNVVTVPDKARGKAVKCPHCAEAIRIPGSSKKAAAKKATIRKPAVASSTIDDDDFLAGMDLRQAEDTKTRICTKCGTPADDPELVDCLNCRHNIDTGIMSQRMKYIIARGGLDPDDFWGTAWGDTWDFMKNIKGTIFRSAINWSIFACFAVSCFYASEVCENIPPKAFWLSLCFVFSMAGVGWGLNLSILVLQTTVKGKNTLHSPHFDIYAAIAWGVRALFWPILVFFPLIASAAIFFAADFGYFLYTGGDWNLYLDALMPKLEAIPIVPLVIVGIVLDLFVHLAWPIAVGHMGMPYTYKAYVPWEVFKLIAKNFFPLLYVAMFALVPSLVIHLLLIFYGQLGTYETNVLGQLSDWDLSILGSKLEEGFMYFTLLYLMVFVATFLHMVVLFLIVGFFAIYYMRIVGYLAYYFRGELEFVYESNRDENCGFSPRYVATLIDFTIMLVFCGVIQGLGLIAGSIFRKLGSEYLFYLLSGLGGLSWLVLPWIYFAKTQSSGTHMATLGKRAVGIIVYKEGKKKLDFSMATTRFFSKILSMLPLGAGCFLILFNDKKQALHDQFAKTLVVWKGDDTRR